VSTTATHGVTTRLWRDGQVVEEDFPLSEVSKHLEAHGSLIWVDLCDPDRAELGQLAKELGLDPHPVEDSVTAHERPKATRHATHTFVTMYATRLALPKPPRTHEHAGPSEDRASRLELQRISAFVMPGGVITVRPDSSFDMAAVLERWEDDRDLLSYGVGTLVHGLIDTVVDGHFETIRQLDDAIEGLEDLLFDEHARTRQVQLQTYRLRKELVEMRRIVLPMREVVNGVLRHRLDQAGHRPELDGYYDDLYDHVLRAAEWTESLRDMITTVFETNLSLQDARLNMVMKKLTGWAAIIAVPTAVTGWFGQNIPYPGFGQRSGLLMSALVILGLGSTLYVVFRRRGWI
jgi:magnesium transporter